MRACDFFNEFYAIDFETATRKRDTACAMGIVYVKDGVILDKFSFICQPPDNAYDRQNIAIHRIFPSQTENEPTIEAYHDEIFGMLNNSNVIAHNISFDRGVLYHSLEKYNLEIPDIKNWHCTYALTGNPLEAACEAHGIELTNHHDALSDAIACAEIYIKLSELSKRTPTEKKKDKDKEVADIINEALSGVTFPPNNFFTNKRIVITGLFHNFEERELLRGILIRCGARVPSSVNKKTDIIVCGELPGPSKIEKVTEINNSGVSCIEILSESQIIDIFDRDNIKYKF